MLGPDRTIAPLADHPVPGAHAITSLLAPQPGTDYQQLEEGARGRGGRQGRSVMPGTVYPEILVVVDEAFFQSMGRDVAATQGYIVSFFNAVNMRFATVRVVLSSLNLSSSAR